MCFTSVCCERLMGGEISRAGVADNPLERLDEGVLVSESWRRQILRAYRIARSGGGRYCLGRLVLPCAIVYPGAKMLGGGFRGIAVGLCTTLK